MQISITLEEKENSLERLSRNFCQIHNYNRIFYQNLYEI